MLQQFDTAHKTGLELILLRLFAGLFIWVGLIAVPFNSAKSVEASTSSASAELNFSTVSPAYINPFMDRNKFRIFVVGDSIANQLWRGLQREFREDSEVEVVNRSRAGTGFVISKKINWTKEIASLLALEKIDIAVVSLGVSDRRDIHARGKRYRFRSEKWRQLYIAQVDRFLDQLRNNNVAVYWVGLPNMRSPKFDADMRYLNRLIRGRAQSRGIKFTSTRRSFTSVIDEYRAWGTGRNGLKRRLRAKDGVHFTAHGVNKLAGIVAHAIKSDIIRTRAERNIQLVGKKPLVTKEVTPHEVAQDGLTSMAGLYEPAPDPTSPIDNDLSMLAYKLRQAEVPLTAESIEERRNIIKQMQSSTVVDNLSNVRVKRARKADRSEMPAHVKVLLVGEPLKPKPGRGDDFTWPRENN
jgi:hypothetical protein